MTWTACAAWICVGDVMIAASTPGCFKASSRFVVE